MAPRTATEVRFAPNACMGETVRGYRAPQVRAYIRSRLESGEPFPSYGEIMRELGFYDRAGAYRVVRRLINNNTPEPKDEA